MSWYALEFNIKYFQKLPPNGLDVWAVFCPKILGWVAFIPNVVWGVWAPNAGVDCCGFPNILFCVPKTLEVLVFPNPIYLIPFY